MPSMVPLISRTNHIRTREVVALLVDRSDPTEKTNISNGISIVSPLPFGSTCHNCAPAVPQNHHLKGLGVQVSPCPRAPRLRASRDHMTAIPTHRSTGSAQPQPVVDASMHWRQRSAPGLHASCFLEKSVKGLCLWHDVHSTIEPFSACTHAAHRSIPARRRS